MMRTCGTTEGSAGMQESIRQQDTRLQSTMN